MTNGIENGIENEIQYELQGIIDPKLDKWELKIWNDPYAENPREFCDCFAGNFLVKSDHYVQNESRLRNDCGNGDVFEFESYEKDREKLKKLGYIAFPVSVYDHSGVHVFIGFENGWDCGCIGWYVVNRDEICKRYDWKKLTKKRLAFLKALCISEVEEYNNWLNGDCYGYTLYRNGEEVDSCSGFIESQDKIVDAMIVNFPSDYPFDVEETKKITIFVDK